MPIDLNKACRCANFYGGAATKRLKTLYHSVPTITVKTKCRPIRSDPISSVEMTESRIRQHEVYVEVPPVACVDLQHKGTDAKITDLVVTDNTIKQR
ncbi:unnamed protein product [Macrosiphum euphorbiae]|uniref:Vitellogenin n=1 Tax=Macrosiphum euphorbiae TaxID=13131 RepID=A0AAV0VJ72_9HEMI|nr:unnamed protein product [Macrosiphum euphorbiae]